MSLVIGYTESSGMRKETLLHRIRVYLPTDRSNCARLL